MHDLKLAFRALVKTPFVTAIAVISLALGIGANAAIYSTFDQMLLRPVPAVPRPDELVKLGAPGPKPGSTNCNDAGPCDVVFSSPMYRDLEKAQAVFTGLAGHQTFGANLSYEKRIENAQGLYGVLAYSVAQRTREFGVRMALGADSGRVRAMVLRQVGVMLVIGAPISVAAAIALGRGAKSMLFDMESTDPIVMAGSVVLLAGVALASGFIPAVRASRTHPMQALRYE